MLLKSRDAGLPHHRVERSHCRGKESAKDMTPPLTAAHDHAADVLDLFLAVRQDGLFVCDYWDRNVFVVQVVQMSGTPETAAK